MTKTFVAISALAIGLAAVSAPSLAADESKPGFDAFRACYTSDIPAGMTGAPVLTLRDVVVVVQPEQTAKGTGTVEWGSVGPGFKPIKSQISGPWDWMCTMKSCSFGFKFSSAPGAQGLKGTLVAPNWGHPGTFIYEFEGGQGPVEQKAKPCN
jgi:hypothetical protein